jgi:NADPH-dependent glutamate synthase beta subunit-like oxidoreductase
VSLGILGKAQSLPTAGTIVSKEILEQLLDVGKLKYCYECGICTGSCPMAEMLGSGYNPRSLLENIFSDPDKMLSSTELWLCAWCYRCQRHCNQAIKLPEIFLSVRKIALEHGFAHYSDEALRKIAENIPLPLSTTLTCFHPERAGLEKEKVLERIGQLYDEHLKSEKAKRAQEVHEERIAIIGSGPAGLTTACELSRKGYGVTIFESLPKAGGMLRKCIPSSRLPKQFVEKEIQSIKDLGVEIKTGITIGQDLNFNGLWREGYKAVLISVGAHKAQKLKIEGADLKGVVHALDFLWSVNSGENVEIGSNVAVVGGGNVAIDAARTALNARKALGIGTKDVTILYRRSREEMPAIPWEVKEAKSEGVKIEFLVSPKRVLGQDGKVCAIECVRMELGEPDESGRKKAISIEGSEFKRETDMVILAIGESPDVEFLPKEVELNDDGTVWTDPITMETSLKGVFAAGDAVTGPATVIEAICTGKRAAASIERYLTSPKG